jgi:hypothetical protein
MTSETLAYLSFDVPLQVFNLMVLSGKLSFLLFDQSLHGIEAGDE